MKRILAFVLILAAVAGLAGCGTETPDTSASPSPSAPAQATPTVSDTGGDTDDNYSAFPITEELTELSVWGVWGNVVPSTYHVDWNDAWGFKALEELTNIRIKWQIPSYGSETESFNLLIASNEYPDIIDAFTGYYTNGLEHAVEYGIALKLDDVISDYMPSYAMRLDEYSERWRNLKTDSGYMAAIYQLSSEKESPWGGMSIRKDWLDDLGLDIPETYDDMHDVLVAFKEQKGATRPMLMPDSGDTPGYAIAGGFGAAASMLCIDGKVQYGPMLPGFKEYLSTMADWYAQGLIDPDFTTSNVFDSSTWLKNEAGYGFGFSIVGTFEELSGAATEESYNTVGVKNLVKNKGDVNHFGLVSGNSGTGSIITASSEQVEIAARWLDSKYSPEGSVAVNFGFEGDTYFVDDEGYPTLISARIEELYSAPYASLQQIIGPVNGAYYGIRYMGQGLKKADIGTNSSYAIAGLLWQENLADWLIPTFVTRTAEESAEYSNIYNDANTLVSETVSKIITGASGIDEYDAMISNLQAMNIQRCIDIQQTAVDRYYAR